MLHKGEDQSSHPQKLLEVLGGCGGLPIHLVSQGGDRASPRASRLTFRVTEKPYLPYIDE